MSFVFYMQGFTGPNNEFILKEVAVLSIDDSWGVTHTFEPPYNWNELPAKYKSTNLWLVRNYHGINWDYGLLPYDYIQDVIKSMLHEATIVYVKGNSKQTFLKQYLQDSIIIIDLQDFDCPSIKVLDETCMKCSYHINLHKKFNCAFNNVFRLRQWICNNVININDE